MTMPLVVLSTELQKSTLLTPVRLAKTWKNMGLVDTHHIGRVLIDPKDSNVVYVAALGHQYTYNEQRGVFKTTDSEKIGVVEVAMDPSDNKTLYAIAWERDRKAWHNHDAGPGSGLYKTSSLYHCRLPGWPSPPRKSVRPPATHPSSTVQGTTRRVNLPG